MNIPRQPPPPGVVAAAEQEYHAARGELTRLINAVDKLVAGGHSELEAVVDVWMTLRMQQQSPIALLVSATAIVRLTTLLQSATPLGPDEPPNVNEVKM